MLTRETGKEYAVKVVRIPQLKKKDLEGLKEEVRVMQKVCVAVAGSVCFIVSRCCCCCLQLRHKNIVRLEEVYRTASMVHIVTELCTGGELFEQIIKKVLHALCLVWGVLS